MIAPNLVVAALTGASNRQAVHALRVLGRVVTDRPDRVDATRAALDDRLPDLVGRAVDDEDLRQSLAAAVELLRPQVGAVAAIDRLPPLTARTARLVGEVLLTAGPSLEAAAEESEDVLPELARLHNNLNVAFGYWREWEWAVKTGRRAVELNRRLVGRDGAARWAGLASALSNLAVALADAGDADDGLAAGEEAVALYRQVVDVDGDSRYRRSLANALTNHSARLGRAARVDEALSAIDEAVEAWHSLVVSGEPDAAAGLARSLSNRAVRLGVLGRHDEALAANDEALRIRRELVGADADEHLADLAMTLSNRSTRLGAVGRAQEAVDALLEAIRIRRELAADDPDGYLADLATSLHNLSFRLTELDYPVGERLAASSEAVRLRRQLARSRPGTYRAALAAALHTESVDLADVGDAAAAVRSAEEAVTIRRSIAAELAGDDRSDEHLARLASSLRNLSIAQAAAGRSAPALGAAEEAVEIHRGLATRWPDTFREDLAGALANLSSRLDEAGRSAEALAATREGLGLRRLLARDDPDRYLGDLASSLNNLSVDLSRAGHVAEAAAAGEEGITIRRRLAAENPDRYRRILALNLNNHGVSLADLDRPEEAVAALDEAVGMYRALVEIDPRGMLPELVMAVGNLADQLYAFGRRDDAGQLFDTFLTAHADTDWAVGVIRLGRGWWHVQRGALQVGIDDLCRAGELLVDDLPRQAAARIRLRRGRQLDRDRFDVAWAGRGELPVWLRHVEVTDTVADAVRDWVDTVELDDAEALLAAQAGVLLTDEAEARLHHLVDANPEHSGLRLDRDLIRRARARGVAVAYSEYRERLWRDGVAAALDIWVSAADPDELHAAVSAEPVLLRSLEAVTQTESRLAADPVNPALLVRAGLLALCRSDGIDAAFQFLGDDTAYRSPPRLGVLTAFKARDLALARLRAGRQPDDPDAAFAHAVLAVLAGHDTEAEAAIVCCAQLVPSWRRRELAATLTDLIRDRLDLADRLARLRALLAGADRAHTLTS